MNHEAIAAWWAAVFPWLVVVLVLQRALKRTTLAKAGWMSLLVPGVIALAVLLIPVQGAIVARWIATLISSVSIPFVGLAAVAVWGRAFEKPQLSAREWRTAWIFGAVAGLFLYPMALGIGSMDPYEWGWSFGLLFVVIAVVTAWLIWMQNRFGLLLLLAAVAFQLRLLESTNYWDYLVDPIYCAASVIALGKRLTTRRAVL